MSRSSRAKKRIVPTKNASQALGLYTVEAEKSSEQCIYLDVEIHISQGRRTLHALLDSGAHGNFISQAIVLEERIALERTTTRVNGVGGQDVTVYGRGPIEAHASDARGVTRGTRHPFYAANLVGFELILGMPWLKSVNPEVNWANREWVYRESTATIQIDTAENFIAQDEVIQAGLIIIQPMNVLRDADVSLANLEIQNPTLLEEYQDFADVFAEDEKDHRL
jgi:hypothetical protein